MSKPSSINFEKLYEDYRTMVYHLCLGFTKGDTDRAHDLSQETFINCWRAFPKFRAAASPKTWVYRIAVNTCLQHLRGAKSRPRVSLQDVQNQLPAAPTDASQAPYQALYRAIGELNEVDRLIITLVLEETDYEEIAEIMGLKAGTLRVRIHRIKQNLKQRLKHESTV